MNLIEQFLQYLINELGYSPLTAKAYGADLVQWADFATDSNPSELDPLSVSGSDLRLWIASLPAKGLSPYSIKRKSSSLKSFFKYLVKYHGLLANPADAIVSGRIPKPIPVYVRQAETKNIIDEAETATELEGLRNALILDLFYTTGIRCSELTSLKNVDVDTRKCELKVVGKRNKHRVIPFGPELAALIDRYRTLRDADPDTAVSPSDPEATLLTRSGGAPLYRKLVYNVVHRLLTEGGAHAERLSPHVMRHSCATDMLNAGASIASVKDMLGHSSLASTQVYTHVTYRDLKNNYQLAHPRAQKKGG